MIGKLITSMRLLHIAFIYSTFFLTKVRSSEKIYYVWISCFFSINVLCFKYKNLFVEQSPDGGVAGTTSLEYVVGKLPFWGAFLLLETK